MIMLAIIPTLYAGYIVSVHRMVMENRPVDPGSISGSHRPTVIMREMAPIGEMAPGCGTRSKKEILNCIFAPPSERWHRVRSQRCKSKSECYRTGPTR